MQLAQTKLKNFINYRHSFENKLAVSIVCSCAVWCHQLCWCNVSHSLVSAFSFLAMSISLRDTNKLHHQHFFPKLILQNHYTSPTGHLVMTPATETITLGLINWWTKSDETTVYPIKSQAYIQSTFQWEIQIQIRKFAPTYPSVSEPHDCLF